MSESENIIEEKLLDINTSIISGVTEDYKASLITKFPEDNKEDTIFAFESDNESENKINIRKFIFGSSCKENERNRFASNKIDTAKYSLVSFLPKNLFEQFNKAANIYFLLLAFLQIIPSISITGGKPTILIPLGFVILVNMVKDFIEDRKRQISDKRENNSEAHVLHSSGEFNVIKWEQVKVGDIVMVKRDEQFPADLILLNSSSHKGVCYVETKNLDGETNLKYKISCKETIELARNQEDLQRLYGGMKCELPNPSLYTFEGILKVGDLLVPLSSDQLLLRGSILKNTAWIYAIVTYTGPEAKIQLNSSKAKSKISIIEKTTHKQIVLILILQLLLSSVCAIGAMFWLDSHPKAAHGYLEIHFKEPEDKPWFMMLKLFSSWVLITVQIVPLSLLVSLDIARWLQAAFINWDAGMFNEEQQSFASVQSSNLNEELGMVNYIFSDKTGTLTSNIMKFRKISVKGMKFGSTKEDMNEVQGIANVNFVSKEMEEYLNNINKKEYKEVSHAAIFLALCHSVLIEEIEDKRELNGSSPDEIALVNAAKYFGYEFLGRDENAVVSILYKGVITKYPVLNILDFTCDRKRMSIITRMPNGKILLMCKGADNVIYERLSSSSDYKRETQEFLVGCAQEGLRTLVLAEKEIPEDKYTQWNKKYQEASREVNGRNKKMEEVAELIEQDLFLLGATAIEDKLQENVGEVIEFIKRVDIHFWVLTGDKIETAVNIAISSKLLTTNSIQSIISSRDKWEVKQELKNLKETIEASLANTLSNLALVITGDALLNVMGDKEMEVEFIQISKKLQSVIACRVSPKQKAEIINLVKAYDRDAVTLAIGDGANDVNMIAAAHVGVGIRGLEGQQAARASDYATTNFQHLKNLLFVHGREATRRNGFTICYFFYKNTLLITPSVLYALLSAGSAQSIYNDWLYQLFNTVFSTVPIVCLAALDKEYEREQFLSNPSLYEPSKNKEYFSQSVFWKWMRDAFLHGSLLFAVCLGTMANTPMSPNGILEDLGFIGGVIYTLVIILVNLQLLLEFNTHSAISLFFTLGSIIIYYPFYYWISFYNTESISGSFGRLFTNPLTVLLQLFIIITITTIPKVFTFFTKYSLSSKG